MPRLKSGLIRLGIYTPDINSMKMARVSMCPDFGNIVI